MNKVLKYAIIVILVLTVLGIFFPQTPYFNYFYKDKSEIIFEKSESWGPCTGVKCSSHTTLHESGRLDRGSIFKPVIYLDKTEVTQIRDLINSTHIMDKKCEEIILLDYYAEYTLRIDGKTKVIEYPGCKTELETIEKSFLVD